MRFTDSDSQIINPVVSLSGALQIIFALLRDPYFAWRRMI